MGITFKSKAAGDLFMLSAHADALLAPLGKRVDQPGTFTAAELPGLLSHLRSLADETDAALATAAHGDPDGADDGEGAEPPLADAPVSLRKRAVPLVRMAERALAAGEPIVWGV
jgi:hypothetical protein